ncbi:MAG: FtsX-like permease family protein, partial [Oscillospiraceae bacterium]
LVVAGLSIMTVMLVSVNERTKEIGIKKSIGASSGRIVKEFMLEALFLSILGSLIGAMIGILVGGVGGVFAGIGFSINGGLILSCVGFAVFTGLIFGAYPALKAARLKPADALRRE